MQIALALALPPGGGGGGAWRAGLEAMSAAVVRGRRSPGAGGRGGGGGGGGGGGKRRSGINYARKRLWMLWPLISPPGSKNESMGLSLSCMKGFKMCVGGGGVRRGEVAALAEKSLRIPDIIITPPTPTGRGLLRDHRAGSEDLQDTC